MKRLKTDGRIFLSPPHMGGEELGFVQEAFESNYIAPLGPMVDAFEEEFCEYAGFKHAVALSSGTAAMHLALRYLGVGVGDEVFTSTLTFIGSVSPVTFLGARPVFIDCDRASWNMDPDLLERELALCSKMGRLPKAVVPTDLYGQCCHIRRITEICDRYHVPVVCDSAEGAGAWYRRSEVGGQRSAGTGNGERSDAGQGAESTRTEEVADLGSQTSDLWAHAGKGARAAVFSFNGNKIITTSGGGILASDDKALIDKARFWSQQAREPFPHYEHREIGYNYRMSNIAAAIGRGQLRVLDARVARKREIFDFYQKALEGVPGISFMPEAAYGKASRWLTVIRIDPEKFGADRETVRLALEEENIESRPVWKPMHMQPVFEVSDGKPEARCEALQAWRSDQAEEKKISFAYPARSVGGALSESFFETGLCLPSGTALGNDVLAAVAEFIRGVGNA